MTSRILEYDNEEEFKDYLMSIINSGGVVGRVFTKEVSDEYANSEELKEIAEN